MKILQDFIAPFVRFAADEVHVAAHQGTAFFIDSNGTFLTARHVVEACDAEIARHGGRRGLVMRHSGAARVAGFVSDVEFADPPFDIAIGRVDKASKSYFVFDPQQKLWMWTEVYAAGYPTSAVTRSGEMLEIDARGFKGTVLRQVHRQQLGNNEAEKFELSFAITNGLSGAPLVLRGARDVSGREIPQFVLAGVCVASIEAAVVAFAHTEVVDGAQVFTERTSRIEQYGIAHDLRALANWRPRVLGGKTLAESVIPSDD